MDAIVYGFYNRNTFLKRVLDHMSSQYDPIGGNPSTYGDLFQSQAGDGPLENFPSAQKPKLCGNDTQQVRSVAQMPRKAKAEFDELHKVQALRASLKGKYGSTFFSEKPAFPAPVRGPYGEAKIRVKPDPRVYRHQEFTLTLEIKEAMQKIVRELMNGGWL